MSAPDRSPSASRPRWAERLRWSTDPNWGVPDWVLDHLWWLYERPVLRGLCLIFGHGENFYGRCVYCGKPQDGPMHGPIGNGSSNSAEAP